MSAVAYADALAVVDARLGNKAAKHSQRVATTAAELAAAYGVDVETARLAGLLHDWDREMSADELLGQARAAGIEVTAADIANPRLLHSRTGAVGAREALPALSDEVVQAISRHTVGARGMTPLDMVVYLADMIEPHRNYPGVDELRAAVGVVSLSELFARGYQESMRHLVEARKPIHPETVVVWNDIVAGDRR